MKKTYNRFQNIDITFIIQFENVFFKEIK